MLSDAFAVTATAPKTEAPFCGAVMATVGGVGSAGSTTFEKCTGVASVPAIFVWSLRTSHPFNVCDPTWTPE